MRAAKVFLAAGALSLLLAGCETGRVNKLHSPAERASDVTTVPHPNPEYASLASGNPPVPGSPTAAGTNGMQPKNDNEARKSPGSDEGRPMAPREQPVDAFVRQ